MGFNNKGVFTAQKLLKNKPKNLIIGGNIGKNKDTENALSDYLPLLEKFYSQASYITINISSPNSKNLRDLQKENCIRHHHC